MDIIRGIHNLPDSWSGCVLTIGNFDGVHRGHQAVLHGMQASVHALQLPSLLMTFEPHPAEFFRPEQAPARLTSLRDKVRILDNQCLNHMLIMQFAKRLAELSAETFIAQLLVDTLKVKALIIGDDFRFGAGRRGDYAMLQQAGEQHGFTVTSTESFCLDDERVSSTAIRSCLHSGDFAKAAEYLGRPYSISGRVFRGDQRGRELGFPTANLPIRRTPSLRGVFAVRIHGLDHEYGGVANLGTRPTVGGLRTQLEVHLFNFNRSLYNHCLEIEFLTKIRDERRFDSLGDLQWQIREDVEQTRNFFQHI